MTRILAGAALLLGLAGALMGILEAHALVRTSFAHLYAYAIAQMVVCAAAVIIAHRSFQEEIRSDPRNWHRPILRLAPRWAKLVCVAGICGSVAYFISAVGGGVSVTDWAAAAPQERAALFVGFSIFNYLALVGLSAAAERAA